jgi:hypothetical protein
MSTISLSPLFEADARDAPDSSYADEPRAWSARTELA